MRLLQPLVILLGTLVLLQLALPPRVVSRIISGGSDGIWVVAIGAVVLAVLTWWRDTRPVAVLDALAIATLLLGFGTFEHNRLIFLVPTMLGIGWLAWRMRRDTASTDHRRRMPASVLVIALVVLASAQVVLGARIDTSDVGYSSVLGANAMLDGRSPYADVAVDANAGATYGPLAYESYVPAAAALSDRTAQRVMGIAGHLLLALLVVLLGRSVLRTGISSPGERHPRNAGRWRTWSSGGGLGGLVAWMALPATAYTMSISAHDDLATVPLVASVLVGSPIAAGALLGLATGFKIFPAIVLPLLLARSSSGRQQLRVIVGFGGAVLVLFLPVLLLHHDLHSIFKDTLGAQGSRTGLALWNVPISDWREHGIGLLYNLGLGNETQVPGLLLLARMGVVAAVLVLAASHARLVRAGAVGALLLQRDLVAKVGCALLLLQLVLSNWNWNYLAWWAPFVAVTCFLPRSDEPEPQTEPGPLGVPTRG